METEEDLPVKAERREKKKARRKYGQSGGSLRTVYRDSVLKKSKPKPQSLSPGGRD